MPNCFSLTKRGEDKAMLLQKVDAALWEHFEGGEPEGNSQWYRYWYNTIGLDLAMGRTWEQIREALPENSKMFVVVDYLKEHYVSDAWYEQK